MIETSTWVETAEWIDYSSKSTGATMTPFGLSVAHTAELPNGDVIHTDGTVNRLGTYFHPGNFLLSSFNVTKNTHTRHSIRV